MSLAEPLLASMDYNVELVPDASAGQIQRSRWEYAEFPVDSMRDVDRRRLAGWELLGLRERGASHRRTAVMRRLRPQGSAAHRALT